MTDEQRESLKKFLVEGDHAEDIGGDGGDYAAALIRKRKRECEEDKYEGLKNIPGTRVFVERAFSKVRNFLTKKRNRLFPITLKARMFLKENWKLVTTTSKNLFLSTCKTNFYWTW